MKLPFYTIIVPHLRRHSRIIKKTCSYAFLNFADIYTCVLGILGAVLSIIDIVRIIRCGSVLPDSLCRSRIESGKVISPEGERDLKLISLVFSFEYYILLVLAIVMNNPTFLMPWLLLYILIMGIEFINAFLRLFLDGFQFSKHNIILSVFLVYNWLAVFCAFSRMLGACPHN